MAAFVVRRILVNIVVFVLIGIGVFLLVRAAPGDPVRMMIRPEDLQEGSEAFIQARRAELGLDDPVLVQYGRWFLDAITGNLGDSFVNRQPVSGLLLERLGPTVLLMSTAIVISLLIAIPLGTIAAVRRNTGVDYAAAALSLGVISVPSFFFGIIAIYVFSLQLGWLPSSGMSTPGGGGGGVDVLRHLIMPAAILGLASAGPLTRYVRGSLIDELSADYVRTAEAKGASPGRVVTRHALRNSLIPLITIIMINIPQMLAGAVVLEQVFAWPGMGQLAVRAVTAQDYPVIVGFALYVAALVLICNLLADIAYAAVDPRVKVT
ncbi:ABC transporter permease [Jiangella alkaliphila]|uniref:Peptide/nickel transport system permease protein n=1 Tax=Jiangella alkaliphila TaxID=419479 RepID=A0A1H2JT95_9ACTN|nr:ABC transporter permease [Jiangella alkaliphila]SDU59503.1 peptide/nickel transport system permease protein [Jiangella alkaliphila]